MKDTITTLTQQFRAEHKAARRSTALLLALALTVTLFVNWQLHGVGIAKTADYQCGEVEHEHTAECYQKVLVCGYEEGQPEDPTAAALPEDDAGFDAAFGVDDDGNYGISTESSSAAVEEPEYIYVPHEHTEDCYQEVQVLTCTEEEHEHTDDCFDPEDNSLICEIIPHTHDDSCYTTERELVCGLEEGELVEEPNPDYVDPDEAAYTVFDNAVTTLPSVTPQPVAVSGSDSTPDVPVHHHTDACYREELVCGLPEHHHTVNCLADPQADVESEDEWLAKTNVTLTGMWPEDLVTVAQSQLGYEQSERNFELDADDGVTVRHYTRYGQWYGNPYGEWDVMFLSFCLNYAGVPQSVVPQTAGVMALHSQLRDSAWLQDTDGSTALPGDIVLYNTLTTETVAVETEPLQAEDASTEDGMERSAVSTGQTEPETEERTISTETVGIVTDVPEDGQTLTVISGNVDGRVAEVTLSAADVTSVIRLTEAYEAQSEEESPDEGDTEQKPEADSTVVDAADIPEEEERDFVFRVTQIEPEADARSVAVLAAESGEKRLEDYLNDKDVVMEKLVDGSWVKLNEGAAVENGDTIRMKATCNLNGIISKAEPSIRYQLPAGMRMTSDNQIGQKLSMKDNSGKIVGYYTISAYGEVVMTFTDEDILKGAPFQGELIFKAKADYSDTGDGNGTIKVTHDFELKVTEPDPDLTTSKGLTQTGTKYSLDSDGNIRYNMDVTVSSAKGTNGELVSIYDTLNYSKEKGYYQLIGKYDESSITLTHYDFNGKATSFDSAQVICENNTSPQKTLKAEGLPALKSGEKYVLHYTVVLPPEAFDDWQNAADPGKARLNNQAWAKYGETETKRSNAFFSYTQNSFIEKSSSYDADTGRITWKITVHAPRFPEGFPTGGFLKGMIVKDILPEGLTVYNDTIRVTGSGTNGSFKDTTITEKQLREGYQLPSDTNAQCYYFTFETEVPPAGGTFTNTATIQRTETSAPIPATSTKTVAAGEWSNVSKTHLDTEEDEDDNGLAHWSISGTNSTGAAAFTLIDRIMDATTTSGTTIQNSHFGIASELQEEIARQGVLVLTMRDGTVQGYDPNRVTVQYYSDENGKTKVEPTDSETPVHRVEITVNADESNPVRRVDVTRLTTHENHEGVPLGETWTYKNNAKIDAKSGSASDSYSNMKDLEKELSVDERKTYQSDNFTVDYSQVVNGRLCYRLKLRNLETPGTVTLTDVLPDGGAYEAGRTELWAEGKKVNTLTTTYDAGSNTLTFTIDNTGSNFRKEYDILYSMNIKDDWADLTVNHVIYTNAAHWNGVGDAAISAEVSRQPTTLKKTGKRVEGEDSVKYQVLINLGRETLGDGSRADLEDCVKLTQGAESFYGSKASVKLYYYQVTNGQLDLSNPVYDEDYTATYLDPEQNNGVWLKMSIPDRTPLVLEYECVIDRGSANAPVMSNTVTVGSKTAPSDPITFTVSGSEISIRRGQLIVNKLDSKTGAMLKGAVFTLEAYDKETGIWADWGGGELKTDENGTLSIHLDAGDGTLKADTLYRLKEQTPPAGYSLDSTPRYFIFYGKDTEPGDAYNVAVKTTTGTVEGTELPAEGAQNLIIASTASVTVVDVPNTYQELTIKKLWYSMETNLPTTPAAESISVELYRYTTNPEQKETVETVTLQADSDPAKNWSHTWTGLPTHDQAGNEYHYAAKELTEGFWNTEITGNGVTGSGRIVIRNTVYPGYELPSTGGEGAAPFAAAGGALMAAALIGGVVLSRKKRKEH